MNTRVWNTSYLSIGVSPILIKLQLISEILILHVNKLKNITSTKLIQGMLGDLFFGLTDGSPVVFPFTGVFSFGRVSLPLLVQRLRFLRAKEATWLRLASFGFEIRAFLVLLFNSSFCRMFSFRDVWPLASFILGETCFLYHGKQFGDQLIESLDGALLVLRFLVLMSQCRWEGWTPQLREAKRLKNFCFGGSSDLCQI